MLLLKISDGILSSYLITVVSLTAVEAALRASPSSAIEVSSYNLADVLRNVKLNYSKPRDKMRLVQ